MMYLGDITPEYLRNTYLFGIDLTDPDGNPFPEEFFRRGIEKAKDWLHRELHLYFEPTVITEEKHDYYRNEWIRHGFLRCHWPPVISVEQIRAVFPNDNEILKIPNEWIILFERPGQIQLVPTAGSLSQIIVGQGGTLLSIHTSMYDHIPGMFRISYTCGFPAGQLPEDIADLISMQATYNILDTAGDMILGSAGIANLSISADGLSQSLGSTASPTNAGYGARKIQMEKQIKKALKTLKDYYHGFRMTVL